jgi:hypothetical protein
VTKILKVEEDYDESGDLKVPEGADQEAITSREKEKKQQLDTLFKSLIPEVAFVLTGHFSKLDQRLVARIECFQRLQFPITVHERTMLLVALSKEMAKEAHFFVAREKELQVLKDITSKRMTREELKEYGLRCCALWFVVERFPRIQQKLKESADILTVANVLEIELTTDQRPDLMLAICDYFGSKTAFDRFILVAHELEYLAGQKSMFLENLGHLENQIQSSKKTLSQLQDQVDIIFELPLL